MVYTSNYSGDERVDLLQSELERSIETFDSAYELLQFNEQLINNDNKEGLQAIKKKFILDSFKVNKTYKDYKQWEFEQKQTFIENDIQEYNKMLGKMFRVNDNLETLNEDFENLSSSVRLPSFKFSIKTLELYGNESLLNSIVKDSQGEYPRIVKLDQMFSLDPSSSLPFPDYKVINQLINLEYRLRIERRLKYEVLKLIKNQILVENSRWTTRNNYLDDFLNKQLAGAIEEVDKIKNETVKERDISSESSEDEEVEEEEESEIIREIEQETERHDQHREDDHDHDHEDEIEIIEIKSGDEEYHHNSNIDHSFDNDNGSDTDDTDSIPLGSLSNVTKHARPEPTNSEAESEDDDEMLLDS
ncbi:uncharacterized protein J8A68_004848 [[Candida] subhashii]|uniref:Uncharacterized protein n=1 Tax=[Candida] subhashii TaxID=561895 RepID=A0A8J5Q975_9ASCO|nr:uncharacterized protein J8A68_004848 [[Candida] subhashii]KAG7661581.1 hypothetical protein J8A68_004848 [[Candida] subhashii]